MIHRETLADGRVRIRFTVPAAFKAIAVVGDFNRWNAQRTRFRPDGDRSTASAILRAGQRYTFRYVTAGGGQCNDEAADDYEADELGAFHGVIDLVADGLGKAALEACLDQPGVGGATHAPGPRLPSAQFSMP